VRVTGEGELARYSFYHRRALAARPDRVPRRRGPKTAWNDAALLGKIREVLAASPFYGEGHRKGVGAAARSADLQSVRFGVALVRDRQVGLKCLRVPPVHQRQNRVAHEVLFLPLPICRVCFRAPEAQHGNQSRLLF
jgi:hypothetical protein